MVKEGDCQESAFTTNTITPTGMAKHNFLRESGEVMRVMTYNCHCLCTYPFS